ncbi:MAG: c-type cytochrome [Magnetococcales bacterium]|nr:c-type cytochrome [Magnetococcales bacterium]
MNTVKIFITIMSILGVTLLLVAGMRWFSGDVAIGKRLAENNCEVCHDLTVEQIHEKGPFLWGIYNRPAGITGFAYSPAFTKMVEMDPFVWDDKNLEAFITDPSQFIPDTRMAKKDSDHPISFDGVTSAENRQDLISYLKTLQ